MGRSRSGLVGLSHDEAAPVRVPQGAARQIQVLQDSSATQALFTGKVVTGPTTVTYDVPGLKPGTYYFRCDVHPIQMNGTFVVK